MGAEYNPYAFLLVLLGCSVLFALTPLGLAWVWSRFFATRKPGPEKSSIYECGLASKGDAWIPFRAEYYLYGILFLVFDVEVIFLLPFAVAFSGLPTGALVAMLVFVLLLFEGLVWAWAKGILDWK